MQKKYNYITVSTVVNAEFIGTVGVRPTGRKRVVFKLILYPSIKMIRCVRGPAAKDERHTGPGENFGPGRKSFRLRGEDRAKDAVFRRRFSRGVYF